MHHFFLPPENLVSDKVSFPAPLAHQIKHVLRLKEGMEVEVLDNRGSVFRVRLEEFTEDRVAGCIIDRTQPQREPAVKLTLCVSLTQREKFELILQKNVEVGTACIAPFLSRYSLVREKIIAAKRRSRWEDILREAAEQSGRVLIPTLNEVVSLPRLIEKCVQEQDICLAAWEGEQTTSLQKALQTLQDKKPIRSAAVFIGPEGGFAQQEVELFEKAGVISVSLGKRVLRMETAAIVAPALILYELGQMEL